MMIGSRVNYGQGKGWGVLILLPSDSHEDNADVNVQAVDRTGEPSVHIIGSCFES